MKFKRKSILLIFFSAFFINTNAQLKDTSFKTLESITVVSRNLKITEKTSPYSVTKLDQRQIAPSAFRTTPEALMGASGVFVQKTNHGGGSAFIRGLTGNQTLILVDGIRLNNSTFRYGPNQYLNTIDMFTIDKIEVAKGIGAIEYGSDAMGGVINLRTKENEYSSHPILHASTLVKFISSNMEQTSRTEINYSNANLAIQGGLSLRKFGNLKGGGNVGVQNPTAYNENNIDLKAKLKITKQDEIIIATQNTIQEDVPIYHKIILESYKLNQVDQQIHNLNYIKYKHVNNNNWISEFIVTASSQRTIEQRSLQKINSIIYRNEADTVKTFGITSEIISKPSKYWTFNTGFDYYQDNIYSSAKELNQQNNTTLFKRGLYPNAAKYNNSSLFNLHHFQLGKLFVETGIRYNLIEININDISVGEIIVKPSAIVENLGISYALSKNNFIYSSLTTGYRAPNIDDMGTLGIVDFRYEIPSYDLKPEKSLNTELGYKYSSREASINLAIYNMQLSDIITRVKMEGQVINGYNVYNKKNVESSYIQGFEISLSKIIQQNFNWTSNLTYTYGQNKTKNEPMRRIPPIFGQNKLEWKKNTLSFALTHIFAGKQDRLAQGDKDDNRIGKLGTPNWNLINLDAGVKTKYFDIYINLINVLDEKYKTHGSGVYGMGRAISFSIQWKL
ncbi:MAG: TonB-dependent receptor [Bacteroidetes bacterium]|nr:TonB-dependent receptor [Bacteroidota bacterium]